MAEVRELTQDESEKIIILFEQWGKDQQESHLEEAFALLDRDGSGFIEKADVMSTMKTFSGGREVSEEQAEAEIAKGDTDKDGKISKEEFIAQMKSGKF